MKKKTAKPTIKKIAPLQQIANELKRMNDRNNTNDLMVMQMLETFTNHIQMYGPELNAEQFTSLIALLAKVHFNFTNGRG